jgi:hypothetical protein
MCEQFFFHFLSIKILVKFDPKLTKLIEFRLWKTKISIFFSISLSKNGEILPQKNIGCEMSFLNKFDHFNKS